MNYTPPNKIKITSDNNELLFIKTIKLKTESVFRYRFIKSFTKMDMEVDFTEVELNKNLNNFFKVVE